MDRWVRDARFTGPDLTQTLARIQSAVRGVSSDGCGCFLEGAGAGREALTVEEAKDQIRDLDPDPHALRRRGTVLPAQCLAVTGALSPRQRLIDVATRQSGRLW